MLKLQTARVLLQVSRRYSDFDALQAALQPSGVDFHLPPKKVFGNKDRMFVIERQKQLEVGRVCSMLT